MEQQNPMVEMEELKVQLTNYIAENAHFAWRDEGQNKLITELCDALTRVRPHLAQSDLDLIQRAREATYGT